MDVRVPEESGKSEESENVSLSPLSLIPPISFTNILKIVKFSLVAKSCFFRYNKKITQNLCTPLNTL